ncbi:MmpS family transport accessory protein [Pedobacter cryotolerans]|nr:MmpS family transport accessory protein [Pedobacter cryotolerans]
MKILRPSILFNKSIFTLLIFFSLVSCKKEEIITKEITYQLSGSFGKNVTVKYTPTGGTLANVVENVELPWQKIVIPNPTNASVGLIVAGEKGTPNAIVTAKIFVDGVEERSINATTNANGDFVLELDYLFN